MLLLLLEATSEVAILLFLALSMFLLVPPMLLLGVLALLAITLGTATVGDTELTSVAVKGDDDAEVVEAMVVHVAVTGKAVTAVSVVELLQLTEWLLVSVLVLLLVVVMVVVDDEVVDVEVVERSIFLLGGGVGKLGGEVGEEGRLRLLPASAEGEELLGSSSPGSTLIPACKNTRKQLKTLKAV